MLFSVETGKYIGPIAIVSIFSSPGRSAWGQSHLTLPRMESGEVERTLVLENTILVNQTCLKISTPRWDKFAMWDIAMWDKFLSLRNYNLEFIWVNHLLFLLLDCRIFIKDAYLFLLLFFSHPFQWISQIFNHLFYNYYWSNLWNHQTLNNPTSVCLS